MTTNNCAQTRTLVKRVSPTAYVKRVLNERRLRPSEVIIMQEIAELVRLGGHSCAPGIAVLSERTGLARRTVQRVLLALADLGLIVMRRRYNAGGKRDRSELEIAGLSLMNRMRREVANAWRATKCQIGMTSILTATIRDKFGGQHQGAQTYMAGRDGDPGEFMDPSTGELLGEWGVMA